MIGLVVVPLRVAEAKQRGVCQNHSPQLVLLLGLGIGGYDGTAKRMSHQQHVLQSQVVNELPDILGHTLLPVVAGSFHGSAVAPGIETNHLKPLGQHRNGIFPHSQRLAKTGDQNDGAALTRHLVVEPKSIRGLKKIIFCCQGNPSCFQFAKIPTFRPKSFVVLLYLHSCIL